MQDSDDYFSDDFVLDEAVLAVLDAEESKFEAARPQPQLPAPATSRGPAPPPAKKQKTFHEQRAPPVQRTVSVDDFEELPAISIQDDGSYGLFAADLTSGDGVRIGNSVSGADRFARGALRESSHPRQAGPSTSGWQQRQDAGRSNGPMPRRPQPQPPRAITNVQNSQGLQPSFAVQEFPRSQRSQAGGGDQTLRTELTILRAQIEELTKAQAETQKALKEAQDVRFAKEGEVSILRSGIQKTATQHAAELAKAKAAREAAEAARIQVEKDMKDAMERLKTQFTFKQHELETSVRKQTWSVQSKKIGRHDLPTPIKLPSQMRQWSAGGDSAGPSAAAKTPRRPRFGTIESPTVRRDRKVATADKQKHEPALPGFYNSFQVSTPKALSQRAKGKAKEGPDNNHVFAARPPLSSPPSSPIQPAKRLFDPPDVPMEDADLPSPAFREVAGVGPPNDSPIDNDNDMFMPGYPQDDSFAPEEYDTVEPFNWRDELHRIVFTHTMGSPQSLTFKILINSPLPPSAPMHCSQLYEEACSQLLTTLGMSSVLSDWETLVSTVSDALAQMAHVLNMISSISPLVALLNLIRHLVYSLPSFTSSLLSPVPSNGNADTTPRMLTVVCDVIRDQLNPKNDGYPSEDTIKLASETVGLLEALSWNVPDALSEGLSAVPCGHKVLATLLSSSQPIHLLIQSARALALLATHRSLFRHLLSFPDPEKPGEQSPSQDFGKLPHIEQLAFYLVDPSREGAEADLLRESILTFVATLALSHTDALVVLLQSFTLLPSIIYFLTNVTNPLWEEDDELVSSPTRTEVVIRTTARTVSLLYYMVFTPEPVFNLSHKLNNISHRHFSGISHMFTVTMGRLSFADPPDWVSDEGKMQLEQISEMARNLLELVVEGPELDMVWGAFQKDEEQADGPEDDEEREARLLHPTNPE